MPEPRTSEAVFRFGDFEADLRAGELRRGDVLVPLQDQPFHLLAALLERPGEVVTREEVRLLLWSDDIFVDFDHGLNTAMKKLRDALADSAQSPRFVETLPKRGYRFLVPVQRVAARQATPPAPPAQAPASAALSVKEHGRGARQRAWLLAGLALFAGGAVLASVLGIRPSEWLAVMQGVRGAANVRSLAVLPLEDLSAGGRPFADAVTEALTTDLARTKGMRVISRLSANAFRSTGKTPAEIGRELKVDALVEGSVQSAGDRLRVDLRLIGTSSGEQMWAQRFEGTAGNLFAVEDRASRGLRLALAPAPGEARAQRPPTSSSEAYESYLRGKIRVRRENEEDNSAAIALFERAVALDPGFAAAQAELSHAYALRVTQFAPNDASALERAHLAVEKALRSEEDLAEGHYAAGFLLWGTVPGQFEYERAVRELRRAIALNGNLDEAHHQLGMIYLHIGLLDEAVAEFSEAMALNPVPTNNNPLRRIGIAHIYRGQYEEGLKTFQQVPPESNSALWNYQVAWALLYLGRSQEAWALIERYLAAHPEDRGGVVTSMRAIWFAKAGDARRAEADIRTAREKGKGFVHFHHTAYNIASAYALLGQAGPSSRWLRVAAETGWPCYPYFVNDPNLERIRGDASYLAFIRELKQEWERYRATL